MATDRYVALGLARPRAPWLALVSRWATEGSLPVEFVKCLSPVEARARLDGSRPHSALILDGRMSGIDRDLIDLAVSSNCAVIVIDDAAVARDWYALGAVAVLGEDFDRGALASALDDHAIPVRDAGQHPGRYHEPVTAVWRGDLVAVTGTGGSGTSTMAAALAQGMSADIRHQGSVLLADLSLRADQAVLHDTGDVIPGLSELVEAHRAGTPAPGDITALTYAIDERGYRLLLGLRRPRDWAGLRQRSLEAAIDSLRRDVRLVVADTDPDVEGVAEAGSVEVEERNVLARTTLAQAALVVVVTDASLLGLHHLTHLLDELRAFGIPGSALIPVINRAPRNPASRAEITAVVSAGLQAAKVDDASRQLAGPVFLPERRRLDDLHRDRARLPDSIVEPLTNAVLARLDQTERRPTEQPGNTQPEPVEPGTLGSWLEEEAG